MWLSFPEIGEISHERRMNKLDFKIYVGVSDDLDATFVKTNKENSLEVEVRYKYLLRCLEHPKGYSLLLYLNVLALYGFMHVH